MTTCSTRRIPTALRGVVAMATFLVAACVAPAPTTPVPTLPAPTPAPTTPVPTLPAPTSVPTPAVSTPPFACDETVGRPGTTPVARITGFAAANEAGIGRITFDFQSSGAAAAVPQVEIRPGSPPFTKDPSGLPLDVAGTAFLVVVLLGGTALDNDFKPTFEGPFDVTPVEGPIVEVKRAGDFEAVSSWVVGLRGPPCVRILPFDGNSRLVIEIRETPPGYAARREAGGLALIDAGGSVVAHEGDRVQIGGGETGSDGAWLGCGGIKVGAGA